MKLKVQVRPALGARGFTITEAVSLWCHVLRGLLRKYLGFEMVTENAHVSESLLVIKTACRLKLEAPRFGFCCWFLPIACFPNEHSCGQRVQSRVLREADGYITESVPGGGLHGMRGSAR